MHYINLHFTYLFAYLRIGGSVVFIPFSFIHGYRDNWNCISQQLQRTSLPDTSNLRHFGPNFLGPKCLRQFGPKIYSSMN